MELIRISSCKLKIMLTPTDMCQFHLTQDTLENGSPQMRHAFRLLFAEIKKQTDFDADDSHISVQYFPSREGGCEMFISHLKTEDQTNCSAEHLLPISTKASTAILPAKRNCGKYRKECAYSFSCMEILLCACLRLQKTGYIGDSALWNDDQGTYYLILDTFSTSPFHTPEEIAFLSEYGTTECIASLRLFLSEHGTLICQKDAVQRLAECN